MARKVIMSKPVFVVWGFPYHENSGGSVVLHRLSHEIAALGFESCLAAFQ